MNKVILRHLVGWEVEMPDQLVRFVMKCRQNKKSKWRDRRWKKICKIPGVTFVLWVTTMATYEGEFRVKDEKALEALRQEGSATIIKE